MAFIVLKYRLCQNNDINSQTVIWHFWRSKSSKLRKIFKSGNYEYNYKFTHNFLRIWYLTHFLLTILELIQIRIVYLLLRASCL